MRTQSWHYPARVECLLCHTPVAGYALGFNTPQLNRDYNYGGASTNQIQALSDAGYFSSRVTNTAAWLALAPATNTAASLEFRARSFLAANCVQCHQPGGVAEQQANWDARISTPLFSPAPLAAEAAVAPARLAETPVPQPRPADRAAIATLAAPAKPAAAARPVAKADQIALLLRPHVAPAKADPAKAEPSKSVASAQRALVKLGFVLKTDGVAGGTTRQAIERFERDQGMPVRGDLTPKIKRLLASGSGLPVE